MVYTPHVGKQPCYSLTMTTSITITTYRKPAHEASRQKVSRNGPSVRSTQGLQWNKDQSKDMVLFLSK